jgi:hypothetical protein
MLHLFRDEPQCATAAMVPFEETGQGKAAAPAAKTRDAA